MVDWKINLLGSVETTQAPVHDAALKGAEEGFVMQAMKQTGGKGRQGNQWDSPMGNLYMSVLLRPSCGLERAGELAFVIAVALSKALDDYIEASKHKKTLKWPNDVLVDGLKLSGILLESNLNKDNALESIVLGMGVNIFNAPELAVSLNNVAEIPVYVNKVRDNILDKLSYYYDFWEKRGFAPIRDLWLEQAYGLDQSMTARLPNETYKGIFKGITEEGSLILSLDDGVEKVIHAAEVHFGGE